MGADLGPLLHNHDPDFRGYLLEPDRGSEAGGSRADDDDVELHGFSGGQIGHGVLASNAGISQA
jgi:hypothetical protein